MAQLIVTIAARVACCLWLSSVVACSNDDGPAVPFKLDPPAQPSSTPAVDPATPQEVPAQPATPTAIDVPANATQLAVAGMSLSLSEATFLAAVATDLDQNGNDDALAVTLDARGEISLQRAVAGDPRLSVVSPLHALDKGCTVADNSARVARISDVHVSVDLGIACVSTDQAAQTSITSRHWIFEAGLTPRLLERISVLPALGDAGRAPTLTITLGTQDVDNDQNADLVATLQARTGDAAAEAWSIPLRWLNRVGGLDLDRSEPEATLAAKLTKAKALRDAPDNPARTRALEELVAVHTALCAEHGLARVVLGEHARLPCGRSKAAGSAWALLTKTYAQPVAGSPRRLHDALRGLERLSDAGLNVDATLRAEAETALRELATRSAWQWLTGPSITDVRAPEVRTSAIGFTDDHTLLLRGGVTQSYDLNSGVISSLATAGDRVLRDASGELAIAKIERRCDGYRALIVKRSQIDNGVVLGPSLAEPLLETLPAPANASCDDPLHYRGRNDAGWSILGWTTGAIVASRAGHTRAIPVNAFGHVTGAVRDADDRLPTLDANGHVSTPSAPGAIAPDGSAYAVLTPVGILVASSAQDAILIAPSGPVSAPDLAVAPNAATIAYVFGGRVFIGRPAGATLPAPPSTAAVAAPPTVTSTAP